MDDLSIKQFDVEALVGGIQRHVEPQARLVASRIAGQLPQLRQCAESEFQSARADLAIAGKAERSEQTELGASPDDRPLDPRAIRRFKVIAFQLQRILGGGADQALRKQIGDPEFRDAATARDARQVQGNPDRASLLRVRNPERLARCRFEEFISI